jgi:hypothetical protein
MNRAKIFLVGDTAGALIPMEESDYVAETHLQKLLADYPDLLPGDQLTPDDPRRWLPVAREMGVPGDTGETGRWSLDHLFLDQDGIPTFVECKRSADTRARREVVAQMLDYAANGIEYWGPDRLRQAAAETAQNRGRDLDDEILALLGAEPEGEDAIEQVNAYWEGVEANLREGRVRLLFVADQTSRELRRLVEFLNAKMADVEVAAVEIKQYLGKDGHRAVVPRAIGVTERARLTKRTRSRRHTNREEFFARCPSESRPFFEEMIELAEKAGHAVRWGRQGFSVRVELPESGILSSFAYGWPSGRFDVYFAQLGMMPEDERRDLRDQIEALGIFTKSGNHTLVMQVDDLSRSDAVSAYTLMLGKMNELRERY